MIELGMKLEHLALTQHEDLVTGALEFGHQSQEKDVNGQGSEGWTLDCAVAGTSLKTTRLGFVVTLHANLTTPAPQVEFQIIPALRLVE